MPRRAALSISHSHIREMGHLLTTAWSSCLLGVRSKDQPGPPQEVRPCYIQGGGRQSVWLLIAHRHRPGVWDPISAPSEPLPSTSILDLTAVIALVGWVCRAEHEDFLTQPTGTLPSQAQPLAPVGGTAWASLPSPHSGGPCAPSTGCTRLAFLGMAESPLCN